MNLLKISFWYLKLLQKLIALAFSCLYVKMENIAFCHILITAPSLCSCSANNFGIIFNTKTQETTHVSWKEQKSPSEVQEALGDKVFGREAGIGRPLLLQHFINRVVLQQRTYQTLLTLHRLLQLKSQWRDFLCLALLKGEHKTANQTQINDFTQLNEQSTGSSP